MKLTTRLALGAASIAAICGASALAHAAGTLADKALAYPVKPVRIIVGNAPGGGADAVGRLIGQKLTERWSYPIVVENRGGGVGVIAMDIAARAAPDGHTLLLANIQMSINMALKRVDYDIRKAYAPVVQLTTLSYVATVNPVLPVSSVKELITYARAKPGAIRFGSPGNGSPSHIGIELFNNMAGLDMLHVPYKGNGPAMIDLMSGQIQLLFGTIVSVAPHARSGRLKALAVTSPRRSPALPELPTIAEAAIPGYELSNAYGFFAPGGTPASVIAALNRECNQIIATAEFRSRLTTEGADPAEPNSPEQYRAVIASEVARLQKFFATPGMSERFR